MRRLKIFKIYFIIFLFIFFMAYSMKEMMIGFFLSTVAFNVTILTIFTIGLIIVLIGATKLVLYMGTFAAVRYKKGKALEFYLVGIDKILPVNIANMFRKRATRRVLYFTQQEVEMVRDWLEEKLSNQKVYMNFFTGTALMVGLLGTFSGLLISIDKMGGIILSMSGDINLAEVMAQFAGPLGGMATGFGSSLFGVITAIILNVLGYVLNRNEEIFIEDVMDWMNGQIIESKPTEEVFEAQPVGGGVPGLPAVAAGAGSGGSKVGAGLMDIFVDRISEFSIQMEKFNKSTEAVFEMLNETIAENSDRIQNETVLLENISNGIHSLNVNQYSNTNVLEDSLQQISTSIMNENKIFREILQQQQKNNEALIKLLTELNVAVKSMQEKKRG